MALLDIRDELAAAKDLVGCLYLACRGMQSDDERRALSTVSHAIRERLEVIDAALQDVIGGPDLDPTWMKDLG